MRLVGDYVLLLALIGGQVDGGLGGDGGGHGGGAGGSGGGAGGLGSAAVDHPLG